MLSIRQLETATDSIKNDIVLISQRSDREVMTHLPFLKNMDSSRSGARPGNGAGAKKFEDIIPDSAISVVNQNVLSRMNIAKLNNDMISADYAEKQRDLRLHKIEWHRKITLSLACIVLFMIGAPLGTIIRRGGLGTPLVISVVFFIIYYFISNSGEKFAKEGALDPWLGMWMATFILIPIGVFLIYKALHDSQLFNKEYYFRMWRNIRRMLRRK
jgi:lipopolysaccharide export system permease protein